MSSTRATFAALVFAATVMPAFAFAVDVDAATDDDPIPDVHWLLELEPGENQEVHADWLLDKLNVPSDERCLIRDCGPDGRIVHFMPAIHDVFLLLTVDEAREAGRITHDGIVNSQQAGDVSIPVPKLGTADPDGMTGEPITGPQIVPTGYTRIGAVPPGEVDDQEPFADVDIAMFDTGVDAFADDLNVEGGFDCTFEGLTGLRPADSWRNDVYGHGTFGASVIAARNNDRGSLGVAAGARIWSVPVLGDDGSGSMATLACGADWEGAKASTIEVGNWSLGGMNEPTACWSSDVLHNAFCRAHDAGVINVVSAGNDSDDAINHSPANYAESVVTVSALTDFDGLPGGLAAPPVDIPAAYVDDTLAKFSNYGSVVDFIAPGVYIYGVLPGNTQSRAHGTSFSAPHVTGVFAAFLAVCGQTSREIAVETVLAWSSSAGWGVRAGWDGDVGPDHEPLVRFGAPCDLLLEEES